LKRVFDFLVAALLLFALAPVLLVLAVVILAKIGYPPFFVQRRPGLHEKPFPLVKFRTMSNDRDAKGDLLPNELRLGDFGRWLRSTSLDELPELFNVLVGHMSLVGPRPLLVEYLPYYSVEQSKRHSVRPGITGWAQVNGRNALSWEQKFELDVWYVDNQSIPLDIRILFRTVGQVLRREDTTAGGGRFTGRFDDEMKERSEK
jgi:sugar transferase EpsL